ncbi:MAG: DNA-directed RNA polymerase subunit beta, partial [Bacteroidales bacterium]|nr:DNA-directed RNA polymerase subunit beta [Bacteroidales bacterium]
MAANNIKKVSFSTVKPINHVDLLDVQLQSFKNFFQIETTPEDRHKEGLYKALRDNFPIYDTKELFKLDFVDYSISPPKFSIDECIERGKTYAVPFTVRLRLECTDPTQDDFEKKETDIYLGEIPYMTPRASFIINGAERVIVSQLHRSPGVFFAKNLKTNGQVFPECRVIPFKGAWLEISADVHNLMYAYIDRTKKVPITTLLRAIGYETDRDILEIFDLAEEIKANKATLNKHIGVILAASVLKSWVEDYVDEQTGEVVTIERNEVLVQRGSELTEKEIDIILDNDVKTILIEKESETGDSASIILNTLQVDTTNNSKEAVEFIYRQLRNAEPPDEDSARSLIEKQFFSDKRYNLGEVGRFRINKKLGLDIPIDTQVLTNKDIISIIKYLISLINGKVEVDDIDHLSNRRIRTVGEQIAAQFTIGLARIARTIRERLNTRDNDSFTANDLVNAKTLTSVINSFFGTHQLSQFMDQTNPLSELSHKRRISALGPGGLSRERAGFEVRDVHYTHYGRLCPVETPEGPNIGLISSLCVYAKINQLGFIETPYRKVENGVVNMVDAPIFLSAEEEENQYVAQATVPMDGKGNITADRFSARYQADYPVVTKKQINLVDVAANQIASIAASLIPFMEKDDANRALMGSNMMRQAVPLLNPEVPIVGTGMEKFVAEDSRILLNAEGDGVVTYVDANKIVIEYEQDNFTRCTSFEPASKTYNLTKFQRTNQNTCLNLVPIVRKGYKVKKGQVLCDGYATKNGELALGRNLMVAFMPWKGYNFEDAIVISEKVVKDDIFTSINIEQFSVEVRETKQGAEELTSDIPNVGESYTKDLDRQGIIRIGAEVKEEDILVGKTTPKGESNPSPENKLLRAIFGQKAAEVKDSSKRVPPSVEGTIIKTNLYSKVQKLGRKKDKKGKDEEQVLREQLEKDLTALRKTMVTKLVEILKDKTSSGVYHKFGGEPIIAKGQKFTQKNLEELDFANLSALNWTTDTETNRFVGALLNNYSLKSREINGLFARNEFMLKQGDDLPNGINQIVKVYIAKKRKLKIGDK